MSLYNFTIYGNIPALKNGKIIITKPYPHLVANSRVQAWNKSAIEQIEDLGLKDENLTQDLSLSIKIYKDSDRRYDADNCITTVQDVLTKSHFIKDDSQFQIIRAEKMSKDKNNPRVEVTIDAL